MELKQGTLEQLQTKLVVLKAKSLPDGEIEAVLSTDDLDRHGEHVSIKGIEIPKNQVIKMYYNHETYGDKLPIGKWLKVWKSNGKLMGHGLFDLEDDFAYKVYRKVKNGFIDSISIGFRPSEFDGDTSTWTKSVLVEASVVAEPANVNAVITSKVLGFTPEEFKQSLKVKLAADPFVGTPGFPSDEAVQNAPMDKPADAPGHVLPPTPTPAPAPQPLEPDSADPPEELNPPVITPSDEKAASDTEVKALIEELKSRLGAVEETLKASTDSPSTKLLIKLRGDAKKVDKAADELNKVLRITLKGKN